MGIREGIEWRSAHYSIPVACTSTFGCLVREDVAKKASHLHNFQLVSVQCPPHARCAWLTHAGGARLLEEWEDQTKRLKVHKTWLEDTKAGKGKIWHLEIATDACMPSSGKTVTLGCVRTQADSLASAKSGQKTMQRPLALPDAQLATEIRASLCARVGSSHTYRGYDV